MQNACAFLERLSRCVKPPLFQTLSQDCVKSCLLSLLDTAEAIDASLRDQHPLRVRCFELVVVCRFHAFRVLHQRTCQNGRVVSEVLDFVSLLLRRRSLLSPTLWFVGHRVAEE